MLNEWLRNMLHEKHIKQNAMALELTKHLGRSIDAAAMNKMIKGTRKIAADELLALEAILGEIAPTRTSSQKAEILSGSTDSPSSFPREDAEDEPLHSIGTQEQIEMAFKAADDFFKDIPPEKFVLEAYSKVARQFLIRIIKNAEDHT